MSPFIECNETVIRDVMFGSVVCTVIIVLKRRSYQNDFIVSQLATEINDGILSIQGDIGGMSSFKIIVARHQSTNEGCFIRFNLNCLFEWNYKQSYYD